MQIKCKIGEILEKHRGERHLVVLHDFPDPDALASAFAHQLISSAFDVEADVVYGGRISHQQNLALVRLMAADLQLYEEGMDLARYQAAVFVDNQGTTVEEILGALESAKVPILLVVDHHAPQDRLQAEFSDIQQVGATSTIYACYLEQGAITMDTARGEHVRVATALMHGILSDTGGFIRAGAEDFQAAVYLSRFRDAEMLEEIMSQLRSTQVMEIIHRALGNRTRVESYSIAGIGYLRTEDRDAIPEAANFLLTEENIHTALVYGILEDDPQGEMLVGSLRTSKLTFDPDAFVKEVFGKGADNRYYGGGKPMAAGFAIPIGFLSGNAEDQFRDLKWDVFDIQIKHKILTKIGAKPKAPSKQPPATG